MPRPLKGRVRVKTLADGTEASYAIVRDVERLIGYDLTPTQLKKEMDRIVGLAKAAQPWWEKYGSSSLSGADPSMADMTVHLAATELVDDKLTQLGGKWLADGAKVPS